MTIPNTARTDLVSGLPGTISHEGPTRAVPALTNSGAESNNVFGRAFTYSDVSGDQVEAGGTGAFAGIMINPKAVASDNDGYVPNGTQSEFLSMGAVYAEISAGSAGNAPAVGEQVAFNATTGALTTDVTNDTAIVGAQIIRHKPASDGSGGDLAIISLTGPQAA